MKAAIRTDRSTMHFGLQADLGCIAASTSAGPEGILVYQSGCIHDSLTTPSLLAFPTVMEINDDKVDEAVLALLWLTLHDGRRAWKGHDWDVLSRLHQKGLILDPVGKAKSVVLTNDGLRRSEELFKALFTNAPKP